MSDTYWTDEKYQGYTIKYANAIDHKSPHTTIILDGDKEVYRFPSYANHGSDQTTAHRIVDGRLCTKATDQTESLAAENARLRERVDALETALLKSTALLSQYRHAHSLISNGEEVVWPNYSEVYMRLDKNYELLNKGKPQSPALSLEAK